MICTGPNHTGDDGQVQSLASMHLGSQSPGFTCQWGDCKESLQSRSDLLNHLRGVHLQADAIQAHKRATLDPPSYHGYLSPNYPLVPNLICDWEHCHEELTPFKAPGPSNLNGFDASLLALSNHVFNQHLGLDPYGQHFFHTQQPLSAPQPYSYQQPQQQNLGTLFDPNGIPPSRSLRWPTQDAREWWTPKAADYFGQSNELDQGCWSDVSQSPTWSETSPNHGHIERNGTTRYDPYPPSCRATSALRSSQSKVQAKLQSKAPPKVPLRESPPATQSNGTVTAHGTSKATSHGVGSSTSTTGAANSGTFCCHWTGCAEAGFDFGSSDSLTAHITTQHVGRGKKTYDCFWDGCDRNREKSFPSKQKILRHLQVCLQLPLSPSRPLFSFQSVIGADTEHQSHTGHRPFECDLCHERFSEQASLQQHMRRHTNESRCPVHREHSVLGITRLQGDVQSRMCATFLGVGKRLLLQVDCAFTSGFTTARSHSSVQNAEEASPKVQTCLNMCVLDSSHRPWLH